MFDFDFNLDIEEFDEIETVSTKEKRVYFDLEKSFERLRANLRLPEENESIRMISPAGGWSSCSLLMYLANKENIKNLFITTLRVGEKEMNALTNLMDDGKVESCKIVLCDISKENTKNGKKYDYTEVFEESCGEYGIEFMYRRNHAKVILAETERNYYVIKTSSNFNENPKIEQFIFSNSREIYNFYCEQFETLGLMGGEK